MRRGAVLSRAGLLLALAASPAAAEDPAPRDPLADAAARLAQIVPFVEEACGAKFPKPPTVSLLSEDDASGPFTDDLRPEVERRYATATAGQRETLLRLAASNAARSCVARYSVTAKTIVLVRAGFERQAAALGGGVDPSTGPRLLVAALAHEAVHALDDARFDLAKLYRGATDDESLRARAMIAEGRATWFGRRAAARLGLPKDDDALFLPGGREVKGEREWHLRMTYALGERFVAAVVARGGVALADRALAEPPQLTWSLCDPARWPDAKADERPARVLAAAFPGFAAQPLSDLQLRVRYTVLDGADAAETLLAPYRGGAQALADGTNAAVLAFADETAARAFEDRIALFDAPVARSGTLVLRAEGPAAAAVLRRLTDAAKAP